MQHTGIVQHSHVNLLATTAGLPSGDGVGINCISYSLLPTIEYVTKTPQHSLLKFNETKQKKEGKQSKMSLIFILQQPAGLWRADIDGGVNGDSLTSFPSLLPLVEPFLAASSNSLISLKQLATGGSIDLSHC